MTLKYASGIPFGFGAEKPHHLRDTLGAAWENRDRLGYAWRILREGVCDGCSLGPRGLADDVIPGLHLCTTRLRLLRLNTMGPLDGDKLPDLATLRAMGGERLKGLGRLADPLAFSRGDKRLRMVSWDEALDRAAKALQAADPRRVGFFATSRGLTNEAYYALQRTARLAGTNHIDLAARLCHAASVSGLEAALGVGAPTCQLADFIGTDLLIVWGSNLANNQPVAMKYLHHAKEAGTKVVVVNPFREPGMERYWVPSIPMSALFGTRIADRFYPVRSGGDLAFMCGVLKLLIEWNLVDTAFIADHTAGFEELKENLSGLAWPDLEAAAGLGRDLMAEFAEEYGRARTAVFVWSMGLTQHQFGTQNVQGIVNLALARGMVGREKCGLMPIRGHSGVQGGGECGISPVKFPGPVAIDQAHADRLAGSWGGPVPAWKGKTFGEMLQACHESPWDVLYLVGGNLYETMPDPAFMAEAMAHVGLRVHQDIVLNSGTLLEGQDVLILPAQTRYEQEGGGTSTNTERRIRFTPYIPGPRIGQARPEWWIPTEIGRRMLGDGLKWPASPQDIRDEMARTMPLYAGIEKLAKAGDWVQWGGPALFSGGTFAKMPDGRARFTPLTPPDRVPPDGKLYLATRRGKQFNSITYGGSDPLVGSKTADTFLISPEDAGRLGLTDGDRIRVTSDLASQDGVVRLAEIAPGNIQGYWPRANRLIAARYDPISGMPDYNALVTVEKA
jgi:molybdopterin-dependent oxidoreductase alpha subunit